MPGCGLRLIDTDLPDLLFGKGQNKFTTWSMWARSVDTIFCGNAFLRLKVRKPVKKNNRPNFKNADAPVPANHLLFFAICKKKPRLVAEICDKFSYNSISIARSSSRQIPGEIPGVRRIWKSSHHFNELHGYQLWAFMPFINQIVFSPDRRLAY